MRFILYANPTPGESGDAAARCPANTGWLFVSQISLCAISLIEAKQKMNWTRTLVPNTFAAYWSSDTRGIGAKIQFARKHSRANTPHKVTK